MRKSMWLAGLIACAGGLAVASADGRTEEIADALVEPAAFVVRDGYVIPVPRSGRARAYRADNGWARPYAQRYGWRHYQDWQSRRTYAYARRPAYAWSYPRAWQERPPYGPRYPDRAGSWADPRLRPYWQRVY